MASGAARRDWQRACGAPCGDLRVAGDYRSSSVARWRLILRRRHGDAARGQMIFALAGGCGCHTTDEGPVGAGGREIKTPFGVFYGTNITPDRDTGIGGWSDAEIIAAIRDGYAREQGRRGAGDAVLSLRRHGGPRRAAIWSPICARCRRCGARTAPPRCASRFQRLAYRAWRLLFAPRVTAPARGAGRAARARPLSGRPRVDLRRLPYAAHPLRRARREPATWPAPRTGRTARRCPTSPPTRETGIGKWIENAHRRALAHRHEAQHGQRAGPDGRGDRRRRRRARLCPGAGGGVALDREILENGAADPAQGRRRLSGRRAPAAALGAGSTTSRKEGAMRSTARWLAAVSIWVLAFSPGDAARPTSTRATTSCRRVRSATARADGGRRASRPRTINDAFNVGSEGFDVAMIQRAAQAIAMSAHRIPELFPEGQHRSRTRARCRRSGRTGTSSWRWPKQLEDQAKSLSDAAAAGDDENLKEKSQKMFATCKSCHDQFRRPKEDKKKGRR